MATVNQSRPLLDVYPNAFINDDGDIEIPGVEDNGQPVVIGRKSPDGQSIVAVGGIHNPYGTPTTPTTPTPSGFGPDTTVSGAGIASAYNTVRKVQVAISQVLATFMQLLSTRLRLTTDDDPALPVSGLNELNKLRSPGHALEVIGGRLGLIQSSADLKLPPALGIGVVNEYTGVLDPRYTYSVYSDFIVIEPNVTLSFNLNFQYAAFYDSAKVYIDGVFQYLIANGDVTPPNAAYMRVAADAPGKVFNGAQYSDITYTLGRLPYVRSVDGNFPDENGNVYSNPIIPLATPTQTGILRIGRGLRQGGTSGVVSTTAVDYVSEVYQSYDPNNLLTPAPGLAYVLTDFPSVTLAWPVAGDQVGRLVALRNVSASQATAVSFIKAAENLPLLTLAAAEYAWFKYTASGYEVVMKGSLK